jgi:hypothetical protein
MSKKNTGFKLTVKQAEFVNFKAKGFRKVMGDKYRYNLNGSWFCSKNHYYLFQLHIIEFQMIIRTKKIV